MSEISTTIFVCQLPISIQVKIKNKATKYYEDEGYSKEEIDEIITNIMDDRLCNVEQIMDVPKLLKEGDISANS